MLNSRHIVVFDGNEEKSNFMKQFEDVYRKVHSERGYSLYLNARSLPRAYSITELVAAEGIGEVKRLLYLGSIDPRKQALLSPTDIQEIGRKFLSRADIALKSYRANRVVVTSSSEDTAFVVLADQHYPGWKARIDGEGTALYKANGILRGVDVPPGDHTIVFSYAPYKIYASMALGGTTAFALMYLSIARRRTHRTTR
jgi:hypothetical protein